MLKFLPVGVAGALLVDTPLAMLPRLLRKDVRLNGVLVLLVAADCGFPSRAASTPSMSLDARFWPLEDEVVLVLDEDELLLDEELEDDEGSVTPRRLAAASAALLTAPLSSLVVAVLRVLAKSEMASE